MPTYTNAQYYNSPTQSPCGISVLINGVQSYVPIDTMNPDYANIMALVAENKITVALAS